MVAKKVAATLAAYNSDPTTVKDALPHLLKAEFDFKTVTSNTGGLKLNFLIFSFGGTHKSEMTNDVKFSYVVPPPKPKPAQLSFNGYLGFLARQPKPKDFSVELVSALQDAAQEVKNTRTFADAKFKTLTLSMAYGVTWDLSASASIPISLVTLGPSFDHNRADTQAITLAFEDQ